MLSVLNTDNEYVSQIFSNLTAVDQRFNKNEFEDCEFNDCNFTEAHFIKCRFIDCTFTRCNLSNIKIPLSHFSGVTFCQSKLVGLDWTRASWSSLGLPAALKFNQCVLNDSSFFGLCLDEVVMEECKIHDVDFREGSFARATFSYSDFTHSLFAKTNLTAADFSEAVNYDIDIFNNKIGKAKFSRHEAIRLLNGLHIELVD